MQPTVMRLVLRTLLAVSMLSGVGRATADTLPKPAEAEAARAKLPADLDIIPRDAMCVATVRIPALRDNKSAKWLFDLLNHDLFKQAGLVGGQMGVNGWADFDKHMGDQVGVDGATVERMSFVAGKIDLAKVQNQPDQIAFGGVIGLGKPYDRDKVLKALVPAGTEEKHGQHKYHFDKAKHVAVYFINDRSFVLGTEASIKEFLSQPEKKAANAVDGALHLATESSLVVSINPETLAPIGGAAALAAPLQEPWSTLLREFLDLKSFTLCVDFDEVLRIDLLLQCGTERDQKVITEAFRKATDLGRQNLAQQLNAQPRPKELEPFVPLLKGTEAALKSVEVREENYHLHVPLYIRPLTDRPAPMAAARLAEKRLEEMWGGFNRDGIAGIRSSYRDAHILASSPEQALKLLRERLKPSPALDEAARKAIDDCLNDLDSDEFDKRERATLELIKLGSRARPTVQARLDGELASLEMRRRLERIMEKMKAGLTAEERRDIRALEVLERIGTPEAKEFLRKIADGQAGTPLTRDAKKRLARMK